MSYLLSAFQTLHQSRKRYFPYTEKYVECLNVNISNRCLKSEMSSEY